MSALNYSNAANTSAGSSLSEVDASASTTNTLQNAELVVSNLTTGNAQSGLLAVATIDQATLHQKMNLYAALNEAEDANTYISQLMSKEATRITAVSKDVKREQHRLRNSLIQYQYLVNYYRMATTFVILTLYVTVFMLVAAAFWRAGRMSILWFCVAVVALILAYLVSAVAVARVVALADPSYRWSVTKTMRTELEKQSAASPSSCTSNAP